METLPMLNPLSRDPYGVALGALRRYAEDGRFAPGEALVVTDLAAEIGLSATPMREALACLAGEGLVERRRGRGYFYPRLSAAEILDLYELQRGYLYSALTLHYHGAASLQRAAAVVADDPRVSGLFDAIIEQTGNSALAMAHGRVAARLATALRIEARILADASEAEAMVAAAGAARLSDVLTLMGAYHDRRCALARLIAATLQTGGAPEGADGGAALGPAQPSRDRDR